MRKLLVVLFLLVSSSAYAQSEVVQGKPFQVVWDFTAADLTTDKVVKFEVAIDAGTFFNTNVIIIGGTFVYSMPTGLAIGSHTVKIRGCTLSDCGTVASVPFTIVAPPLIVRAPTNLRLNIPK